MIILFDMDQVLCDWTKEMDRRLDVLDPGREIERVEGTSHFDLSIGKSKEHFSVISEIMDQPGLYEYLEPFEEALEAFREVSKTHTTFIVSSPTTSNPTCASDKTNWVRRHLGNEASDRLILTKDKTMVYGDILIDDKPEIYGVVQPVWTHVVHDASWNQHVDTKWRLKNWKDLPEIISTIESEFYDYDSF